MTPYTCGLKVWDKNYDYAISRNHKCLSIAFATDEQMLTHNIH